jgi:hypothetical protein
VFEKEICIPQLQPRLSILCSCGHPGRFHWELKPLSLAIGSCRVAEIPRGDEMQIICSCNSLCRQTNTLPRSLTLAHL